MLSLLLLVLVFNHADSLKSISLPFFKIEIYSILNEMNESINN